MRGFSSPAQLSNYHTSAFCARTPPADSTTRCAFCTQRRLLQSQLRHKTRVPILRQLWVRCTKRM